MRILLLVLFSAAFAVLQGQPLGLRSSRANLKFIESDTVRIVYEEGQKRQAERVANIIHHMAGVLPIQGGKPVEKISILLQNRTDIPNGYVGLAPWRSEFYTSPPPGNFDLGSLPWIDLLAIHEFRHVQQRSASKTGLTAAAYYLFGEAFFSAIGNISWPNWYLEGDAVVAETVLSNQGRGRLPSFLNPYREKVTSGTTWNYMKARNGSLRDFVPDHYRLGFLMQNYGRVKYGQAFWDNVALESAAYKGLIYPFSKAIKRVSGRTSRQMYEDAMEHYAEEWADSDPQNDVLKGVLDPRIERYEMQSFPAIDETGQLYVHRESYDHIGEICLVEDGKGERVVLTGYVAEPYFSVGGGKIAWAEYRLNSRWEREDHSTIIVYDINKKSRRKVTSGQSYFSPCLSADGESLMAVHDNDMHEWSLQLLDVEDGTVLRTLPNPSNYYYSYPVWINDGDAILSPMRDSSGRMALGIQDLNEGRIRFITEWSYDPIGRPFVHEGQVFFTMSTDWVDRLCRTSLNGGEVEQLSKQGTISFYNPIINTRGDVLFTSFSLQGDKLNSFNAETLEWIPRNAPMTKDYLLVENGEGDILGDVGTRRYEENKYGLFRQPVYVHSWRPIFDDPIYQFEFQSLNVLQSFRWNTGFQWNANSNDIGPYTELTLGMWYPEIILGYSGWTRDFVRSSDGQKFNWFEHTVNAGLRVPFRSFHGPYNVFGSVEGRVNRLMAAGEDIQNFNLTFVSSRIRFANRLRQARKHPITRFGQAIDLTFPYAVGSDTASQFQVQTDFTFPSPIRNHVLWFQCDYRRELESNTFRFADDFNYSRGYEPIRTDQIVRFGVNYQLPLVYPDIGFAGILYVKRIRANLFYDWSRAYSQGSIVDLPSTGAELIFDIDVLNVEPFTFGVRWSHLLEDDPLNPGQRNVFSIFIPTTRI